MVRVSRHLKHGNSSYIMPEIAFPPVSQSASERSPMSPTGQLPLLNLFATVLPRAGLRVVGV